MIKKEIIVPEVGIFTLVPRKEDVVIELEPFNRHQGMQAIVIFWEEMTDYEALYEKCKEMQLKSFKPVAEALGVMYSNRTLYEALLE